MNTLETPEHREKFSAKSFKSLHQSITQATALTIATSAESYTFGELIFNCEFSTISAFAIWLQEHGGYVPAEICAELEIEVRNA